MGIPRAQIPPEVERHFAERQQAVQCVPDVYRAMARIGRESPAAVVVGIDWLTTAELEFFELVGRRHRDVQVYVLGHERARSKLAKAIGTGAAALGSPLELVNLLSAGSPPPAAPSAPPPPEPSDIPGRVRENPPSFASSHNVFDAELDRRLRELAAGAAPDAEDPAEAEEEDLPGPAGATASEENEPKASSDRTYEVIAEDLGAPPAEESETEEESEDPHPVRVPWRRYEGGPVRTPPRRTPPEPADEANDPPLLTPEELDALLGDEDPPDRSEWGSKA